MNKNLFLIFLLFLLKNSLNAQSDLKFGQRLILGTSLTYIFDKNRDIDNFYNEFNWNKNIAVNLTKSLYVGIGHRNFYTQGSSYSLSEEKNRYMMFGVFAQYDFLVKKKDRIFAEIAWDWGNYCTCGRRDPYKVEGLHYFGIGGGVDFPLNRFLSLDFSVVIHHILEDIDFKYTYNQFTLGLNLDIISSKNK